MLVIPAIDLKDGRCVRLRQGDMAAETVYSEDIVAVARTWQQRGAGLIHVVDLNGAVGGEPKNLPQIEAVRKAVTVPVIASGGAGAVGDFAPAVAAGADAVLAASVFHFRELTIGEGKAAMAAEGIVVR